MAGEHEVQSSRQHLPAINSSTSTFGNATSEFIGRSDDGAKTIRIELCYRLKREIAIEWTSIL